MQKAGRVNYEIDMKDKRKRKQVLHINLLCEWHNHNMIFIAVEDDHADWDELPACTIRAGSVDDHQKLNISDRLTPN